MGQSVLPVQAWKHTPDAPVKMQLPDWHCDPIMHAAPPARPVLGARHTKSTRSAPSFVTGAQMSPATQSPLRAQPFRQAPKERTEVRAGPASGVTASEELPPLQIPPGIIAAQEASPAAPGTQSVAHLPPKQKPLAHWLLIVHAVLIAPVPALATQRLQRRSPH